MSGKDLSIEAIDVTVDDGGVIDVNDGGYLSGLGPGRVSLVDNNNNDFISIALFHVKRAQLR